MVNCKICQHESLLAFSHQIRGKYLINYYHCPQCGFLQTEEPYWLAEAYREPINISDTGYVSRNIYLARRTLFIFYFLFKRTDTFLDYAGGYGLLTRLMRDYGLNYLWSDTYTPNLFAQGFEYANQKIRATTCFECFEHFADPLLEIEKMLSQSDTILFSTTILPPSLPSPDWHYYGFSHGQHLSFYSIKSLQFIANKYDLHYYTDGASLHLLTRQPLSSWLFKFLLIGSRLPLEFLFKRLLGSRLETDHRYILEQVAKSV